MIVVDIRKALKYENRYLGFQIVPPHCKITVSAKTSTNSKNNDGV